MNDREIVLYLLLLRFDIYDGDSYPYDADVYFGEDLNQSFDAPAAPHKVINDQDFRAGCCCTLGNGHFLQTFRRAGEIVDADRCAFGNLGFSSDHDDRDIEKLRSHKGDRDPFGFDGSDVIGSGITEFFCKDLSHAFDDVGVVHDIGRVKKAASQDPAFLLQQSAKILLYFFGLFRGNVRDVFYTSGRAGNRFDISVSGYAHSLLCSTDVLTDTGLGRREFFAEIAETENLPG